MDKVGRALHIVAHSFGKAIASPFMLEKADVVSMILFERNALCFLNQDGYSEAVKAIEVMDSAFVSAAGEDNLAAAKNIYGFLWFLGIFDALPEAVTRQCSDAVLANPID